MRKFIACFCLLFMLALHGVSFAQVVPGNPGWVQITVGATASQVLAFDPTRMNYTIHPEGVNARCSDGLTNGQNPSTMPTTTIGYEYTANLYLTNYDTPMCSLWCAAETGTVVIDIHYTSKGY